MAKGFKFTNNVSTHIGLKGISSKVKENQCYQVLFGIYESVRVMVLLVVLLGNLSFIGLSIGQYVKRKVLIWSGIYVKVFANIIGMVIIATKYSRGFMSHGCTYICNNCKVKDVVTCLCKILRLFNLDGASFPFRLGTYTLY